MEFAEATRFGRDGLALEPTAMNAGIASLGLEQSRRLHFDGGVCQ